MKTQEIQDYIKKHFPNEMGSEEALVMRALIWYQVQYVAMQQFETDVKQYFADGRVRREHTGGSK